MQQGVRQQQQQEEGYGRVAGCWSPTDIVLTMLQQLLLEVKGGGGGGTAGDDVWEDGNNEPQQLYFGAGEKGWGGGPNGEEAFRPCVLFCLAQGTEEVFY